MNWISTKEELPAKGRRVLVGIHANTDWPIITVGVCCEDHWLIDAETRPLGMQEVQYWTPIANLPRSQG